MTAPAITLDGTQLVKHNARNRLSAATAHVYTGAGWWDAGEGIFTIEDDGDAWSGKCLELVGTTGTSPYPMFIPLTDAVPVKASTEYTFSARVKRVGATGTADNFTILARDYDSGNVAGTTHQGANVGIVQDEYVVVSHTFTTASDAAKLRIWIGLRLGGAYNAIDIGETIRGCDFHLSADDDPTFEPSVRIASGEVTYRFKVTADDYTPATGEAIVGGFYATGNPYHLLRTDASGLRFEGTDTGGTTRGHTQAWSSFDVTDGASFEGGVRFDGTSLYFYQNGTLVHTQPFAYTLDIPVDDTVTSETYSELHIGSRGATTGRYFNGDIEYVELIEGGLTGLVVARFDANDALAAVS